MPLYLIALHLFFINLNASSTYFVNEDSQEESKSSCSCWGGLFSGHAKVGPSQFIPAVIEPDNNNVTLAVSYNSSNESIDLKIKYIPRASAFKPVRLISSLNVLIVDQNNDQSEYLSRICQTEGFSADNIYSIESWEDNLNNQFLLRNCNEFDLVFIDLTTKYGMNWMQVTKSIHESGDKKPPIVISTSASHSELNTEKFNKLGIDGVFPKPFRSGQLRALLRYYTTLKRHKL